MRTFPSFHDLKPTLCRVLLAVCAALIALSVSNEARADLTITVSQVKRVSSTGGTAPTHPSGVVETNLTSEDCLDDVKVRFSLTLTGIDAQHNLEIWAGGGDCTQTTSRTGTQPTCGQVAPLYGSGAVLASTLVDVRVQDLAQQTFSATKQIQYTKADATACGLQGTSGGSTISVYFLWVGNPGTDPNGSSSSQVTLDMVGPDGPTNVTAGGGDRVAVLKWSPPNTSGSDISGYKVYCAPVDSIDASAQIDSGPADAGATDAAPVDAGSHLECADGGSIDGGVDDAGNPIDAGEIDGGCVLVPNDAGTSPPSPPPCPTPPLTNECGSTGSPTSTGVTVKGLINGVEYAFAVAGTDKSQNPGKLSTATCVAPGPVADFWWNYENAGGAAGGCALEGAPLMDGVMIGGASVFGIALLRRRRKGKRS